MPMELKRPRRRRRRVLRPAQGSCAAAAASRAARHAAAEARARSVASPRPPTCARCSSGVDDVRLEIGFGGGEHLIAEAERHPRTGFIGCEPFVNGMAKALAAIDERKLDNIRLHHGDATELMDWLPAAALARVDLLYPDPWPKRRHWKRRFVQDESVAALARDRSGRAANFVSPPTLPITPSWTLSACCARRISHGRPNRRRRLALAVARLFRHAL